ncbi:hypothetical protein [Mycolicibacterium frederiksbergense]|uniref:Uncharacterized protein n=1 Tax=Mycolicibacterium frederiksbergense TaxID=117567 RepID=A0A6H0RX23_9MYCO|nr:hypothetical protein [Mycolicibacterium frederiksbergense]QIV79494.1 hypothetical protein EXE63_00115 [Mycolicibacterium frederiksbergense]
MAAPDASVAAAAVVASEGVAVLVAGDSDARVGSPPGVAHPDVVARERVVGDREDPDATAPK